MPDRVCNNVHIELYTTEILQLDYRFELNFQILFTASLLLIRKSSGYLFLEFLYRSDPGAVCPRFGGE